VRLRLLSFLCILLASATFESRARAQAAAPAAAPDLKQNITNLASLDFPVRM
jgi:hypothetical protein